MWSLGFCLVTLYTKKLASFTLQGTNISPKNGILKMIFLFPRWDMLIPWRVLCLTSSKVPFPKSWPLRVFWLRACWNYLAGHGFQSVVLFEGICLQDWQQWKHYFQWLKVKDWDLLVHLERANLQPYGAFSDLFFQYFFFLGVRFRNFCWYLESFRNIHLCI